MKIYEVSSYIRVEQIQNCRRGKHIILKNRKRIDREYLSILIDILFHHPSISTIYIKVSSYIRVEQIQNCHCEKHIILKDRRRIDRKENF